MYGAFRNSEIYKEKQKVENEILSEYTDTEKCEIINYQKLEKIRKKIEYGDNIIDYLSGPVMLSGKKFRKEVNLIKKIKKSKKTN